MSEPNLYTTSQGEAWDQVSMTLWGREDMVHHLLAANPRHRHLVLLPADLELTVPDVQVPVREEPPPWQVR